MKVPGAIPFCVIVSQQPGQLRGSSPATSSPAATLGSTHSPDCCPILPHLGHANGLCMGCSLHKSVGNRGLRGLIDPNASQLMARGGPSLRTALGVVTSRAAWASLRGREAGSLLAPAPGNAAETRGEGVATWSAKRLRSACQAAICSGMGCSHFRVAPSADGARPSRRVRGAFESRRQVLVTARKADTYDRITRQPNT